MVRTAVGDEPHIEPDPRQHGMAKRLHVGHGIGQGVGRVAARPCGLGGGAHRLQGLGQRLRVRGQLRHLLRTPHRLRNARAEQLQSSAVFHQHLATQQVHGLDAVRALMDHAEAVVAPVLLHRKSRV